MEVKKAKKLTHKKTDKVEIVVIHDEDSLFNYSYYNKGGREAKDMDAWMDDYTIEDIHVLEINDGTTFELNEMYVNN